MPERWLGSAQRSPDHPRAADRHQAVRAHALSGAGCRRRPVTGDERREPFGSARHRQSSVDRHRYPVRPMPPARGTFQHRVTGPVQPDHSRELTFANEPVPPGPLSLRPPRAWTIRDQSQFCFRDGTTPQRHTLRLKMTPHRPAASRCCCVSRRCCSASTRPPPALSIVSGHANDESGRRPPRPSCLSRALASGELPIRRHR